MRVVQVDRSAVEREVNTRGLENFCKLIHIESGTTIVRRIHRLEVQATDGRLYVLEGKSLPIALMTNAGVGHRGHHLGQVLLNPNPDLGLEWEKYLPKAWPSIRDVLHLVAGGIVVHLLWSVRYAIELTQQ